MKRGGGDERVYFVRCMGFVKIGFTTGGFDGVVGRMATFATGNPFPCTLLWVVKGSSLTEGYLHNHFAEYAVSGEWFRLSGALLRFIRTGMASKSTSLTWTLKEPYFPAPNEDREARRRDEHDYECVRVERLRCRLKRRMARLERKIQARKARADIAENHWGPAASDATGMRNGETRFERDARWAGDLARARERRRDAAMDSDDGLKHAETMRRIMSAT